MLISFEDKIEYHVGIDDIKIEPNELLIVDEADSLLFKDPKKFIEVLSVRPCICFTATPDDCIVETGIVKMFSFKKMNYPLQKPVPMKDIIHSIQTLAIEKSLE